MSKKNKNKNSSTSYSNNNSNVRTIDLSMFLIPVSIILAGVAITVGMLLGAKIIIDKTKEENDKLLTEITNIIGPVKSDIANVSSKVNSVNETVTSLASSFENATGVPVVPTFNEEDLATWASDVNIDGEKFTQCYDAQKYNEEIAADIAEGNAAGVSGTPGFVIGKYDKDGNVTGFLVAGAYPYESFQMVLDGIIAGDTSSFDTQLDSYGEIAFKPATAKIGDDPVKGNRAEGQIAIIEFSDYECPYCERHYLETYSLIMSSYVDTKKAIYVFKDYPLSFHEPIASRKANAANCVKEIGGDEAYFKYHNVLYENFSNN